MLKTGRLMTTVRKKSIALSLAFSTRERIKLFLQELRGHLTNNQVVAMHFALDKMQRMVTFCSFLLCDLHLLRIRRLAYLAAPSTI